MNPIRFHFTPSVRLTAILLCAAALSPLGSSAQSAVVVDSISMPAPVEGVDTITVQDAFVKLPAQTLDLLTTSMRLDMLDYYNRRDSIYEVPNAMEGLSHLVRPLTDDRLQARITPVTTLTINKLPSKKGVLFMSIYTIGDSLQASDSEVRFYDERMRQLKADKYLVPLTTKDFFDFKDADSKLRKELTGMVPFPTVEYYTKPNDARLYARLTVGKYLSQETLDRITPYLRRDRVLIWDGSRFRLEK